MSIERVTIEPTHVKANGQWTLDTQSILPKETFQSVEQFIIHLPANEQAGNHKHERREALFAVGSHAYLLWQDENGQVHEELMNVGGSLILFIIPPNMAHAVRNKSNTDAVILYEYFDDVYRGVEKVDVVSLQGS